MFLQTQLHVHEHVKKSNFLWKNPNKNNTFLNVGLHVYQTEHFLFLFIYLLLLLILLLFYLFIYIYIFFGEGGGGGGDE